MVQAESRFAPVDLPYQGKQRIISFFIMDRGLREDREHRSDMASSKLIIQWSSYSKIYFPEIGKFLVTMYLNFC